MLPEAQQYSSHAAGKRTWRHDAHSACEQHVYQRHHPHHILRRPTTSTGARTGFSALQQGLVELRDASRATGSRPKPRQPAALTSHLTHKLPSTPSPIAPVATEDSAMPIIVPELVLGTAVALAG